MALPRTVRTSVLSPHTPTRLARRVRTLALLATAAALLTPGLAAAGSAPESTGHRAASTLRDPRGTWAGHSSYLDPAFASRPATGVAGMDVSDHQPDVDWGKAWADGARFAYVKATEGTNYRSEKFAQQYDGSRATGMIRGAYHVALPDRSTGAAQAQYFVDNGGGWTPGSRTLPGILDIEHNPYGEPCYGMNPSQMSRWLADFSDTYRQRTGRFPGIYTTTNWWNQCTGSNPDFGGNNPLWTARYAPDPGPLPAGWKYHTFWQFGDSGTFPGDQNSFNGSPDQLTRFAE